MSSFLWDNFSSTNPSDENLLISLQLNKNAYVFGLITGVKNYAP